ncbi:uncharacterized protein LOC135943549 [Cloeon dipterum]|uniref:uncharacterized protein LOC135943549 n=1 Tax=Cloeon dipterum TaxID=197152 RepID=UPI0032205224
MNLSKVCLVSMLLVSIGQALPQVTRNEAALRCESIGMALLAVTSLDELNCLASLTAVGTFWTSGSNEDLNCDLEHKFAWCSIGFNISPELMSWSSSWQQCCALGMESLNLEDAAEQQGLSSLTIGKNATDWKMNFNYWTSGTRKGAPLGHWSWCKADGPTVFSPSLTWERGQPDNKNGNESCVHFRFVLNATAAIMTDRNCTNRYIYACKSSWKNARDQCCVIGMKLMSIESTEKLNCISKLMTKFASLTVGDYWLSGTNLGCPSNFRWCSLDRDFVNPELGWKEGHTKKGLNCVYLECFLKCVGTEVGMVF